MAHEVDLIGEELGADTDACAGTVRLTSVPIIVNRLLAPRIGALVAEHPQLDVELIADARAFSLTRREADLALRLARPRSGGGSVKARRIGDLAYSAYAARGLTPKRAAALPWIGYGEAMAHVPQAGWMARAARRPGNRLTGLRVHDAETALEAAIAGLGRILLSDIVAGNDPRLTRLTPQAGPEPPRRELWLLAHADQLPLTRIRAVITWLEGVTAAARG